MNSRLYVGSRFICERPLRSPPGRGDFRISYAYFCYKCGETWAREIHPEQTEILPVTAICKKCHPYGGTFLCGQDLAIVRVTNNWFRFPKELLLYELSILPQISDPGHETDFHGRRRFG